MANLYVTSAETFSGKSALCLGLGAHFGADGLRVGYMKPVNVNSTVRDGLPYDDDVAFAKQIFGLTEPAGLLNPVGLTPAKLEQQLRGPETDYEARFNEERNRLGGVLLLHDTAPDSFGWAGVGLIVGGMVLSSLASLPKSIETV